MAEIAIFAIAAIVVGAAFALTPKNQTIKNELDELQFKGANEGEDVATFWGTCRLPGQILFAPEYDVVTTSEEVGGKGVGGTTVENQTAIASFLVSFGRPRPAQGTLIKLYFNKKLYFDGSGSAEIVLGDVDYTFYDGTQTTPDEHMESIIGVGNVSANTGECLLAVRNLDLTPFGNVIPSSIEAVISAAGTGIISVDRYPIGPTVSALGHIGFSPHTGLIYGFFIESPPNTGGRIATIEPATGITNTYLSYPTVSSGAQLMLIGSDNFYGTGELVCHNDKNDTVATLYIRSASNSSVVHHTWGERVLALHAETENFVLTHINSGIAIFNKSGWAHVYVTPPSGYQTTMAGAARCGVNEFLCALKQNSTNIIHIFKLTNPGVGWAYSSPIIPSEQVKTYMYRPVVDKFQNIWFLGADPGDTAVKLFEFDPSGVELSLTDLYPSGVPGISSASGEPQMSYDQDTHSILMHSIGTTFVINLSSKKVEKFVDGSGNAWTYYHRPTASVIGGETIHDGSAVFTRIKLRRASTDPIPIGDVVTDLTTLCGITGDASAITREIVGFVANDASTGRKALNQLLQLGLADVFEADWMVKFATLGSAPVGTFDEADLGVGTPSGKLQPLVVSKTPGGVELPRKVTIHYLSSQTFERATAYAEMYTGAGDKEEVVTFTAVLDDDFAQQLAHILIQLAYGAIGHEFTTSRSYDHFHPGDEMLLPTKYGVRQVRILQKDTGNNGIIKWKVVESDPENLLSDVTAGATAPIIPVINATDTPKLKILQLPLMADSHFAGPSPYFGTFVYTGSISAVSFYGAPDGEAYANFASLSSGLTIAQTQTTPDASATVHDWDETSVLDMTIVAGSDFFGATDAALLAGSNYAAYGAPGRWEIVQYGDVAVLGATARRITHLLRGRKGTEWAMDQHVIGDEFIALTTTTLTRQYLDLVAVGSTYYYKAVQAGTAVADAIASSVTIDDIVFKPYAPIDLAVVDNATIPADKDLSWVWRTRQGGVLGGPNTLTDGVPGTMSDADSGTIEILASDLTTVLNTYAVTGQTRTYTSAEITADYSGTPTQIHWRVAQDASTVGVGLGYPSEIHSHTL